MKLSASITGIILTSLLVSCNTQSGLPTSSMLATMSERINHTLEKSPDITRFPRTLKAGELVTTNKYDWTSGFFPGNLWYMFELTGSELYRDQAIIRTEALDSVQYWSGSHDVGFMMNCSYGNALRLTGNKAYEKVLIQTAASLCNRFSPVTRTIKSWDYAKAWNDTVEWHYPVIIDNMMNLELLFRASQLSGDPKYAEIAVTHAQTTMKNHYREDYSCYHVVNYDTLTGAVLDKGTHQGFTDASSWSRGQAWGLYGYVMTYRFTKDTMYLNFAAHIADYLMQIPTVPEDGIPYWDYMAPDTALKPEWDYNPAKYLPIPRDAAAAAIMASALLELSTYTGATGVKYRAFGEKILHSLSSPPYFGDKENDFFILSHCTGSLPHNSEVDVPLVYADYYFMEGLLRLKALGGK